MQRGRCVIAVAVFFGLLFMSVPVYSANLMVGLTSWYASWDQEIDLPDGGSISQTNDETLFLGPVVAFQFYKQWTISGQFIYGVLDQNLSEAENDGGAIVVDDSDVQKKRFDSDFAVTYAWRPWLKVFLGWKYAGYNGTESHVYIRDGAFDGTKEDDSTARRYGPAIGLGTTIPIVGSLYFSGNISYLLLRGGVDETVERYNTSGVLYDTSDNNWDIEGWSINTTMSLSYYIASIRTAVSLGFRYQYLKYDQSITDDDGSTSTIEFTDKFYGVTLGAVYFFEI